MTPLIYTLVSDGPSDRALLPVLDWVLRQNSILSFQPQWAEMRRLRNPPKSLENKIRVALELYPCDLLFVHRDAEREAPEVRVAEIRRCLREEPEQPAVCVVPVRMQEAWLLFDESALRTAAGNPRGQESLDFPPLDNIESLPDPKNLLYELLKKASGLRPGRLRRFNPAAHVHRLAELIEDFAPLRRLPAFQALENDLRALLEERSWA